MKKFLLGLVLSAVFVPTAASALTLSQLVEFLIALDLVAPDKVELARSVAAQQEQASRTRPDLTRNLYLGMEGNDVQQLQEFLRQTGDFTYPESTGYYGSITALAVQGFQCREMGVCSGSPETNGYGVVGPRTQGVIINFTFEVPTTLTDEPGIDFGSGTPTPADTGELPQPDPKHMGWDYNLTKRCVKTVNPAEENYYEDKTDCAAANRHWTIAVQSEKVSQVSFPGPTNQSFLINGESSPVSLEWLSHVDEMGNDNYSVNLETNFHDTEHPGGSDYFTWYVLMDHAGHGGGPLPRPDDLTFSAIVNYNDFVPQGGSRLIAAFQGFWNGKAHLIEINLAEALWADAHPDADVVYITQFDGLDYITLDGNAMGIGVQRLVDTQVTVPWYEILQDLVDRGHLEAPQGGWENSASQAVLVGTETKNEASTLSVIADLWVTNFRVEEKG